MDKESHLTDKTLVSILNIAAILSMPSVLYSVTHNNELDNTIVFVFTSRMNV